MAEREPMLGPVSVPSAAEVVAGQLRRAIELGRFLPGDQLPPERELAVQLGVSRVTLRAALGELEAAQLLRRARQGSGGGSLVIAAPSAVASDAAYRALRAELAEVYEFRLACESAAAALAAARRGDAQLARLRGAIEELEAELTPGRFRAADNAFHLTVAEAAGNRWLRRAVEDARAAMFGPLDSIRFEVVLPSTVGHHRRILEAIAAGDGERARASMAVHVREAQQELLVALALVER